MKLQRPALLVLIGACVFAIGASLVVISLHSAPAPARSADRAARTTGVTGAATTTASGQAEAATASEVAIPAGDQAVAVTPANATAALAGYLGPGDMVDVYASDKVVTVPAAFRPCAALVASAVPVIDVSAQTPEYRTHAGTARSVPGSVTVLLAATGAQAPALVYAAQNEQVYLSEIPHGGTAASTGGCTGEGH